MLKEYAEIKKNIDLHDQLQAQMKEFVDNTGGSGMGIHPRGSGMSSFEGLSGFKDDTGNNTADDVIPSDKYGVGRDTS